MSDSEGYETRQADPGVTENAGFWTWRTIVWATCTCRFDWEGSMVTADDGRPVCGRSDKVRVPAKGTRLLISHVLIKEHQIHDEVHP